MRLASAFSAGTEDTSSFTWTITIENTLRLELNAATRFRLAQIRAEAVAVISAWLRASVSHTEPPTEAVDITNTAVGLNAYALRTGLAARALAWHAGISALPRHTTPSWVTRLIGHTRHWLRT